MKSKYLRDRRFYTRREKLSVPLTVVIALMVKEGCDATHYGPHCSHECSDNCIQKTCNNITGFCTHGCETGFYGDSCNNACSPCPEGCNKYTGECEGSCPNGKFGARCEKNCGYNYQRNYWALQSVCDNNTGICTSCVDGMFGESCNQTCSCECAYNCERYSGDCYIIPTLSSSDRYDGYTISIRFLSIFCLSVVINILFCTCILRKKMCKRQTNRQTPVNEIAVSTVVYDSVADNSGYQELGQVYGPSQYEQI